MLLRFKLRGGSVMFTSRDWIWARYRDIILVGALIGGLGILGGKALDLINKPGSDSPSVVPMEHHP
jgi:hypothetical protein